MKLTRNTLGAIAGAVLLTFVVIGMASYNAGYAAAVKDTFQTPEVASTPTPEPPDETTHALKQMPSDPIEAFPAIGKLDGIIPDPEISGGLECDSSHTSIGLNSYAPEANYNGTILLLKSKAPSWAEETPLYLIEQSSVTLTLSGSHLDVTSVIIHSSDSNIEVDENGDFEVDADGTVPGFINAPDPDLAVNMTPEMVARGITMQTYKYVTQPNYISWIELCVAK